MVNGSKAFAALSVLIGEVEGGVAVGNHALVEHQGAAVEVVIILFGRAPAYLGDGVGAGIIHVFGMAVGGDILGPEVGLHAEQMRGILLGQTGLHGLIGVDLGKRSVAAD